MWMAINVKSCDIYKAQSLIHIIRWLSFIPPKYGGVLMCCFSCPVIEDSGESLKFNSQFESGNLRKAVQVRK